MARGPGLRPVPPRREARLRENSTHVHNITSVVITWVRRVSVQQQSAVGTSSASWKLMAEKWAVRSANALHH